MSRVLSCEWTTGLMTDYLEGALTPFQRAGMGLHLGMCPRCRAFLTSLRRLPGLVREILVEAPEAAPAPDASALLEGSLAKALGRIKAGEADQPLHHPPAAALQGSPDGPLRMLLQAHLGRCHACRDANPELGAVAPCPSGKLPPDLKDRVWPESQWKWNRYGLGGAKAAEIFKDEASGSRLWLAYLPAGARFPYHRHGGQEATLVLNGWLTDGPDLIGPGDFLQHEGGSGHAPTAEGTDGCWVLAYLGPGGLRFRGWRGLFG